MRFRWQHFLLVACILLPFPNGSKAQEINQGIVITHAWIRAMPPSIKSTALYLTIENKTTAKIDLQTIKTPIARIVEIHQTDLVRDMMKMNEVKGLRIPAGGKAVLKPNGFHLMLIDLVRPLKEGETIPFVLEFSHGTSVTSEAIVSKWGEE